MILLALLLAAAAASPEVPAADGSARAAEHYRAGRYAESADAYAQAIAAGGAAASTYYDAACSSALCGRIDDAFALLDQAIAHGFTGVTQAVADSDLDRLRNDDRWPDLFARIQAARDAYVAALPEPALARELADMRRRDLAARRGATLPELAGRDSTAVDRANTARLKEIVAEHGWPVRSLVGDDGARSAWLLAQHADADPAFQRRCLALMQAAAPGDVDPVDAAYLTDRIRVNEGRPQVYGTQFGTVDGTFELLPVEDEERVDERRAEAGLPPLAEDFRRMTGRAWGTEAPVDSIATEDEWEPVVRIPAPRPATKRAPPPVPAKAATPPSPEPDPDEPTTDD